MASKYWTEFSDRKITAPVPPKDTQPSGGVTYVEKTKDWGSMNYGSPGPKRNTVNFKEVKAYVVQHLADDAGMMKGKKKMDKVMHEYGMGELHSRSKEGPLVRSRKQAIAIGLSEAGLSRKKKKY